MNLLKMLSASECLWLCLAVLIPSASAEGSRIKVVVREGSDAILPCSLSTKENIVQELFHWKKVDPNEQEVFRYDGGLHYSNGLPGQDEHFRGRVSHFPLELQSGNATIIIKNTVVPDSGNYTCDLNLKQKQTFRITLLVGAAPKPLIHILKISEDEVRLKCEVRGAFPKPKVEWRDGDGNILPAEEQVSYTGERYNVTLLTTVTRTNSSLFHCVATQEEIGHKTEDKLYIAFCENLFKDTSGQVITGWLAGCLIGMLIFALVLAVLVATKTTSIHCNRGFLRNANSSSEETTAPGSETGPEELNALHNSSVV